MIDQIITSMSQFPIISLNSSEALMYTLVSLQRHVQFFHRQNAVSEWQPLQVHASRSRDASEKSV